MEVKELIQERKSFDHTLNVINHDVGTVEGADVAGVFSGFIVCLANIHPH